ncbi:small subunit ribosomal protein S21 [Paragonimus westermani]|uniref:Small subunit ribosomal protein S21 n=1 Tax=Paragonimus westermani TaxID=34504 RepID=A0A5J4P2W5_9TREM|nr:small subunit ribosomal protein S21 [Paragonimus westermani]
MKSFTKGLATVGRVRLPGWGPRDSQSRWLETLGEIAANRAQWRECCRCLAELSVKILRNDKVINTIQTREYYEKPTRWRRRIMYERCKRIYDSEMSRKINFIVRTHRVNPWPR